MSTKYGHISDEECALFDELLATLKQEKGGVRFLEIGVSSGDTMRGVVTRCRELGCAIKASGVDFAKYKPTPCPLDDYAFYEGDSMDAWRNIKDTFNLLLVDGCHCVNHAMCDFLNYSPLVEEGGYVVFHDTSLGDGKTVQDTFPQDHSYAGKPPSVLGVREGLKKLGLLQGYREDWKFVNEIKTGNGLMGMVVLRKIMEL